MRCNVNILLRSENDEYLFVIVPLPSSHLLLLLLTSLLKHSAKCVRRIAK
jgi:hypothetical protein